MSSKNPINVMAPNVSVPFCPECGSTIANTADTIIPFKKLGHVLADDEEICVLDMVMVVCADCGLVRFYDSNIRGRQILEDVQTRSHDTPSC